MRSAARRLLWIGLGLLLAAPVAYLLLALALGSVARNEGFRSTAGGYTIYVRSNGTHVTLLLPTETIYSNWPRDFPVSDMQGLASPLPYIAFGWGDRDFMTTTPSWADLNPLTALRAISGTGRGAMHVEYVPRPGAGEAVELQLDPKQFARLVSYIRSSFVRNDEGRPLRIDAQPYGTRDAFYEAVPVYTPRLTCNEWARRGLDVAGVRVPVWSPFDRPIFWQLEKIR